MLLPESGDKTTTAVVMGWPAVVPPLVKFKNKKRQFMARCKYCARVVRVCGVRKALRYKLHFCSRESGDTTTTAAWPAVSLLFLKFKN
jgi:hypothetical protein